MTVTRFSQASISVPAKYRNLMAGDTQTGDFELISTTILTSTAGSVIFSSLPTNYKHLQIRATARSNRASYSDNVMLRFNGDTAANYSEHNTYGNGSSVTAASASSVALIEVGAITAATASASTFGALIIDIVDPFSGLKNTIAKGLTGFHQATTAQYGIGLFGGAWRSNAAVTSITLAPEQGTLFDIGSRFSIYGIKG